MQLQFQFNTVLRDEFELMRQELIALYDSKGMRASGKFEEDLEVQVGPLSATMLGAKHTEQLEYGRRPGPVSKEGVENIKQWILNKNVFNAAIEEIGLSSLAFLIARKIAREGFDRKEYGGVELVSQVVTPARIQSIINKVGTIATHEFVSSLNLKTWQ